MKNIITLVAVCLLSVPAFCQEYGPSRVDSFKNTTVDDGRYFFGWFGKTTYTGSPAVSPTEASEELFHYTNKVREWNMETVASLWFQSWRTTRVSENYRKSAALLDEALVHSWGHANPQAIKYTRRVASSYRQIAELLTAGPNTEAEVMAKEVIKITYDLASAEQDAMKSDTQHRNKASTTLWEVAQFAKLK